MAVEPARTFVVTSVHSLNANIFTKSVLQNPFTSLGDVISTRRIRRPVRSSPYSVLNYTVIVRVFCTSTEYSVHAHSMACANVALDVL